MGYVRSWGVLEKSIEVQLIIENVRIGIQKKVILLS